MYTCTIFFVTVKTPGGHCINADDFYFTTGPTSTVAMLTVLDVGMLIAKPISKDSR